MHLKSFKKDEINEAIHYILVNNTLILWDTKDAESRYVAASLQAGSQPCNDTWSIVPVLQNVYSYQECGRTRWVVAVRDNDGSYKRPMTSYEMGLTGLQSYYAKSLNGMPSYGCESTARDMARKVYGYSKLVS